MSAAARRVSARAQQSRRLRRFVRVLLVLVSIAVIVWVGLGAWFLSDRHRSEPVASDAIVMLAGADDGRHRVARNLLQDGYAPELLVSNPDSAGKKKAAKLCRMKATDCFSPMPKTTAGEVRAVREAAEEAEDSGEGWESILVVTNKPHAARAGAFFRRCLEEAREDGGPIAVRVVSIEGLDKSRLPIHVLRETAGFIKEATVAEAC